MPLSPLGHLFFIAAHPPFPWSYELWMVCRAPSDMLPLTAGLHDKLLWSRNTQIHSWTEPLDASGNVNVTPEVNSNTPAAAAYRPSHSHAHHGIIPTSSVGFWSHPSHFSPLKFVSKLSIPKLKTIHRIFRMIHDSVVFSPFLVAAASIATFGTEPYSRLLINSVIEKKN